MPKILSIQELKKYTSELLKLAFPILLGELGHILTGVADVAVISRYSTSALASVSIANSILFTVFIFGLGILNSITVVLANKRGQREHTKKLFTSCFTFSLILSVIFTLLCLSSLLFINKIGFEKELIPNIKLYILIVSFSMPGIFIFQGIKEFLQAYEIVKYANIILLSSVVVNFILNIIFVFGFADIIPAMGVEGAAYATLIVRTMIALAMILYVIKLFNRKKLFDTDFVKYLIKIGMPIGAAWMLEFLAFNIISILVGRESGILSACHSILTSISCVTFAFPVSIAIALSVKTSFYNGAKNIPEIKRYSKYAFLSGVGFMIASSICLLIFPEQIMSGFTKDLEVIKISLPVLFILASYQIFDGFQTITGGILKGLKMTKTVSFCVTGSYWLIGAPLAFVFVKIFNWSLSGYWAALSISLFAMGIFQATAAIIRIKQLSRQSANFE